MAEQVGLATIGSNRAGHLDEGVTLALGGGVNEASQDVLADTGFSTDQQGRLRIPPPPDRYEVKDSRGLQDGRDTFGPRTHRGHCPIPHLGSSWGFPCAPYSTIGVESRRFLRSRQFDFFLELAHDSPHQVRRRSRHGSS